MLTSELVCLGVGNQRVFLAVNAGYRTLDGCDLVDVREFLQVRDEVEKPPNDREVVDDFCYRGERRDEDQPCNVQEPPGDFDGDPGADRPALRSAEATDDHDGLERDLLLECEVFHEPDCVTDDALFVCNAPFRLVEAVAGVLHGHHVELRLIKRLH